jgi:hypothetical protein
LVTVCSVLPGGGVRTACAEVDWPGGSAGLSSGDAATDADAAGWGVRSGLACIAIAEKVASKTVAETRSEAEIESDLRDMCVVPET